MSRQPSPLEKKQMPALSLFILTLSAVIFSFFLVSYPNPAKAVNPHGSYSALSNLCRECHKTHVAPQGVKKLAREAPEIEICYACHDGSGSTFNIRSTFEGSAAHDHFQPPAESNIKCLKCHHPHAATNWPDGGSWMTGNQEENLCYTVENPPFGGCHRDNITGHNVYPRFQKSSHHPVENSEGAEARVECSSCHGPHTVKPIPDTPDNLQTTNPANTYELMNFSSQGIEFCLACHKQSPWPIETATSSVFVPYDISFTAVDPAASPFFPGWDKTAYNELVSPAAHFEAWNMRCNACHDPHGSDFPRLTKAGWTDSGTGQGEEDMCFGFCHTGLTTVPDIKIPMEKAYHHPTIETDNVHSDTEDALALGSNRHAECYDCHDPHQARQGTHTLGDNTLASVLNGVKGVSVTNSPGSIIFGETNPNPIAYEYQLCFKCHSSYATGYTGSDKAAEFNIWNPSYHPLEDGGKNNGIREEAFTEGTPWNPDSGATGNYDTATSVRTICSDCHGNNDDTQAQGPHGSDYVHILKKDYQHFTGPPDGPQPDWLCFDCHDYQTYVSGSIDYSANSATRFKTTTNSYNGHTFHVQGDGVVSPSPPSKYCFACHGNVHGLAQNEHLFERGHFPTAFYIHYNPGEYSVAAGKILSNGGADVEVKAYPCGGAGGTCHPSGGAGPPYAGTAWTYYESGYP